MSKLYIVAEEKLEENNLPEADAQVDSNQPDNLPDSSLDNLEASNLENPENTKLTNKILDKVFDLLPKVLAFFKKIFSVKMSHVLYALGALIFSLFIFLLIELKKEEYQKELIGYVKIHHKVPEWYKDQELPIEAKEHLEIYKEKMEEKKANYFLVKIDKNSNKPVLASPDAMPLDNKKFIEILRSQDLGRTTAAGVEKPEAMGLSGYDLSQLDFKYFREFIGADLRYTNFSEIEEEGLSFRGSSLSYAQFVDSLIPKTNFVRSFLSYTNFYEAILDGSSFIGVNAENAHFNKTRIVAGNFTDAALKDCDFGEAMLDQINFKNAYAIGTSFNNSSLKKANFKGAQIQGSSFVDADLEAADFTNANLEGVDFSGANLLNTKFDNADVTQADFSKVRNATWTQLSQVRFLLTVKALPEKLKPKKQSWVERFSAPHDPSKKIRGL